MRDKPIPPEPKPTDIQVFDIEDLSADITVGQLRGGPSGQNHRGSGTWCWCEPEVTEIPGYGRVVKHHLRPPKSAIRDALKALLRFAPEPGDEGLKRFFEGRDQDWNEEGDEKLGYYSEDDENAPLFSEAFTYLAFGKDHGRTRLALFHEVCRAAGIEPHELENEVYAEDEAEKVRLAEIERRREERRQARQAAKGQP